MPEPSEPSPVPPAPVSPEPFRLRSLGLPVYVPTFLFAVGQGAIIPIVALLATQDLRTSAAFAALVVGLRGIGTMAFDIPSGMMVARFGERYSMLLASVALIAVAAGVTFVPSPLAYAALVFVLGCSWSVWALARLSYVSEHAPVELRGRALALIGGTNRAGNFVGPAIGGIVGTALGLEYVFWMQAGLAMVASAIMVIWLKEKPEATALKHGTSFHGRLAGLVVEHRRILITAGGASMCLQVLRASRQAVIPLWGDAIGLDAVQIGFIFTIATFFDMLLFYPVGAVMDRFGRKWAGVPSLAVLALSMMLVPLADSFVTLVIVSGIAGFGNGLGSGINMTLGADFAPPGQRGEFLGIWRLVGDVGTAAGPVVVSGLTAAATLGVASVATGGIGLVGAAIMLLAVPETLHRSRPRGRAAR